MKRKIFNSIRKKHGIPKQNVQQKTPKHTIERSRNPFGHLSDLLGLKGSFIPSQAHQNWLADEQDQRLSDADIEAGSERRPFKHAGGGGDNNEDTSEIHGSLPINISPRQNNFIAATPDSNKQRQKFLKWEHRSGSLDLRHFPSKYLHVASDAGVADDEVAEAVEDAQVAPRRRGHGNGKGGVVGSVSGKYGSFSQKLEGIESKKMAHNIAEDTNRETGIAAKKGYMGYMTDGFDSPIDHVNHMASQQRLQQQDVVSSYAENKAMREQGEVQPLTHSMINNLQLDPAWDAMETKILTQHGQRPRPMSLPANKIEQEMMPPEGEPIGQPYLPSKQPSADQLLTTNFQKTAAANGYALPREQEAASKLAQYYSHYEAQTGPHHNIKMGGALGKSFDYRKRKHKDYDDYNDDYTEPLQSAETKHRGFFSNENVVRPLKRAEKVFNLNFLPQELPTSKKVGVSSEIDKLSTANIFDVASNELN
eukprot:gene17969-19765_t